MDNLISRKQLRLMKTEECAGHTIEYAMGWKACIEWIKSLPSAQRWIPVTERLPEDDTIVLVTFSCGKVGTSSWHEKTKYNNGFDCFMNGFYDDGTSEMYPVTAWMPLPEPYQEV